MSAASAYVLGIAACVLAQTPSRTGTSPASSASSPCPEVRQTQPSDRTDGDEGPRLSLKADVDGDGRSDDVVVEESQGSGERSVIVNIKLADGMESEIIAEISAYAMTMATPVPPELLAPGRECVLALVERLAFGGVQTQIDPSLAWLLAEKNPLQWIAGPPVMPKSYTIRVRNGKSSTWISYSGATHTERFGRQPFKPVKLAQRGGRVLLGTQHGVILTNPARSRHVWIYVYPGGDRKLRLQSIRGARIEGRTAVISIEPSDVLGPPDVVRVDLETGRIQ